MVGWSLVALLTVALLADVSLSSPTTAPGCTVVEPDGSVLIGCGPVSVRSGCMAVLDNPFGAYPDCCAREVCPEAQALPETTLETTHSIALPEVQCYDEQLDRHFRVGEKWDRPGCGGQATCRPGGAVSTVGCPLVTTDTPGCGLDDGDASLEYPQCCPKITCGVCHSPRYDKYFTPGDTWTDSSCTLNQCTTGPYGEAMMITTPCDKPPLPYPDCEVFVTDLGRGDFPQCCPQLRCPDRCEDHGQWYRVGEQWEDAEGCSRKTCNETDRIERLTCSPPSKDYQSRPGCRMEDGDSDAPFPACCSRLSCYPDPTPPLEMWKDKALCHDSADTSRTPGESWYEPPCVLSTCVGVEDGVAVIRNLPDCSPPPSPDCLIITDGQDYHKYPTCCPSYRCPGHCFSSDLNRWFAVGQPGSQNCHVYPSTKFTWH